MMYRGIKDRGRTRDPWTSGLAIVFLVLLTTARDFRAQEPPNDSARLEEMEAAVGKLRNEVAGRIEVSGTVRDQVTGAPVQDASVAVTTSIFTGRLNPRTEEFGHSETRVETVDGNFRFNCQSCTSLELVFVVESYHSERVIFYASEGTGRPLIREVNELQIDLEPLVNPVESRKYKGELTLSSDPTQSKYLPILRQKNVLSAMTPDNIEKVKEKNAAGVLPYVQLKTTMDKAGVLKAIRHPRIRHREAPVGAVLDFSAADGGVVVYQPKAYSAEEIDREMRLAPADGYQPTLELDPSRDGDIYFYVRIGQLYGRGRVGPPVLNRFRGEVMVGAYVSIELNPNGTRNLETRY